MLWIVEYGGITMDARENYVMQKESRKEKSICPNCIHHNLCIAENNQPCFECNRFIDANGVTVQEWIPVTERLPEKNDQWVLCLCVSGAIEVLKFDYTMWNWDAQYPGRCYMENYVTHWMPLPQPPKGE